MATPGKFTIEIAGDAAKFRAELAKVTTSARDASNKVSQAFGGVRTALAGIGVSLSVAGFAAFIKSNIDALDRLGELAQIAGISATKLAGIGFAAKQSGVDMETLSRGIKALNLELAKAQGGDPASQDLFRKLGIDPNNIKSADQALLAIADRFATYSDGAGKAALANAAFKKVGAELIPVLNQGGEELRRNIAYFERYSGVNDAIVEKANAFNDELDKLSLLSGAFGKTLTSELLPSMTAFVRELSDAKEKGDSFEETAQTVASGIRLIAKLAVGAAFTLRDMGEEIGASSAALRRMVVLDFAGAQAIFADVDKRIAEREARMYRLLAAIDGKSDLPPGPDKPTLPTRAPPKLANTEAARAAEAEAKAIVAQRLKSIEQSIQDEKDLLKSREQFLDLYYRQDLVSIEDYYDTRRTLIADALRAEVAAYDEEIRVLERQKVQAAPGRDRVDIETKIAEVVAKRGKAEAEAAKNASVLYLEQGEAAQKFLDKLNDLQAKMLELRGDAAGSAAISFDLANRQLSGQIEAQRQSSDAATRDAAERAAQYLADLRRQQIAQAELNQKTRDFDLIMEELSITQGRLALTRSLGGVGEIEFLTRLGEANKARVAELTRIAEAYRAIAVAANDPRAIAAADAMNLKIEELSATADLAAKRFNDIFADAFADGLVSIIDGTKSVSDAFRDMERSIVQAISRIAAQNIAGAIFGQGGAGSGIGSFFASLFGGGKLPGFASGTSFAPGGLAIVGERGPELVNLPRGAQVIPSRGGHLAPVVNIAVHQAPGASRASSEQLAAETGRAVQRALRSVR